MFEKFGTKIFETQIIRTHEVLGTQNILDQFFESKFLGIIVDPLNPCLGVQLDLNGKLLLGNRVWPYSVLLVSSKMTACVI